MNRIIGSDPHFHQVISHKRNTNYLCIILVSQLVCNHFLKGISLMCLYMLLCNFVLISIFHLLNEAYLLCIYAVKKITKLLQGKENICMTFDFHSPSFFPCVSRYLVFLLEKVSEYKEKSST